MAGSGAAQNVVLDKNANASTFYEIVRRAFHAAAEFCSPVDHFFRLQDQTFCLRFAGPSLVPLITSAIQHLRIESHTTPSLTVCIWDDASTGMVMPPPPWGDSYPYTRRGDVRGYNNEQIHTAYNFTAGSLSVFHRDEGIAFYWTRNAQRLPGYEMSAPLRTILHWWCEMWNGQLVHAAAVGGKGKGALLVGKGGSGKSTTALRCLLSGFEYISDDYCMITVNPQLSAHSIYSSAKLNSEDVVSLTPLLPGLANSERLHQEKAVFFLYEHFRDRICNSFPIRVILIPSVSAQANTTFHSATPHDAFRALALSTMSQLASAGQTSIARMHELVQRLPSYHLMLGADRAQVPNVISEILDRL